VEYCKKYCNSIAVMTLKEVLQSVLQYFFHQLLLLLLQYFLPVLLTTLYVTIAFYVGLHVHRVLKRLDQLQKRLNPYFKYSWNFRRHRDRHCFGFDSGISWKGEAVIALTSRKAMDYSIISL